ncbi:N-acyl homoserine lactonase family protein [Rhodococcus wratislaviensis]|uniref:N-acyl homoserine lactonase family protein n=1 Tax=Rhodococcus wratislaviensis TaxID=44752 RepID=UPI00351826B1
MTDKGIRHIWALDAPTLSGDISWLQVGAGGKDITIPVPTFLIEHDQGLVLFDTGLAADGAGDPRQAYGDMVDAFPMHFPEEFRLDRQLAGLGFATSDVRRIVLSHLHFDHTGGLQHFPGAEGYIGPGELRYARSPDPLSSPFFRDKDLETAAQIRWNELPRHYEHDMFGDGTVTMLSLPGHTPGSIGLQLRLDGHTLILTGDAAHLRSNVECLAGTPVDVDTATTRSSLLKLNLLSLQPNTTVWIGHDPDDWLHFRRHGMDVLEAIASATS